MFNVGLTSARKLQQYYDALKRKQYFMREMFMFCLVRTVRSAWPPTPRDEALKIVQCLVVCLVVDWSKVVDLS